jgi:hypothetical protein
VGSNAFEAGGGVGERGSVVGGGAERVGVGEREIAEEGRGMKTQPLTPLFMGYFT